MAKYWKLLCLLLTLTMLFGVLAGCKKQKEEEPVESDSVATELPMETVNLAEYSIVRSQDAVAPLASAAANMKVELDAKTGSNVNIEDDFLKADEKPDPNKKEILIGKTNREESATAQTELGNSFTFSVRRIGAKLVIVGATAELIMEGIDYLLETYAVNSAGDGTFRIPEGLNYTAEEYGYHELIADGVAKYNVVYSQDAPPRVFTATKGVLDKLNSIADTDAMLANDWLKKGQQHDLSVKSIVIGATTYTRSQELLKASKYFAWSIETNSENQIYLYASDSSSVETVCAKMKDMITCGTVYNLPKTVRVIRTEAEHGMGVEWSDKVPSYEGGTMDSINEFNEGFYRLYFENTTRAAFDAYNAKLVAAGYTLYGTNTIENHVYNTYRNADLMIHTYYLDTAKTVSVLVAPAKMAAEYPKAAEAITPVTSPTISMLNMDYPSQSNKNFGMGFIYTLSDGSYVVIDGGFATEVEPLYNFMKDNNKHASGQIHIRAWIITHPDGDHYSCFNSFATKHAKDVKLHYFLSQFDYDVQTMTDGSGSAIQSIKSAVTKFAGVKKLVPLMGQKMYFGDMEMTFLYTAETIYQLHSTNNNDHSLVMKINYGGQSFMITGDIMSDGIKMLTKTYSAATLKCDFAQAPHHGLNGSNELYDKMAPSYLFMCTDKTSASNRLNSATTSLKYLMEKVGADGKPIVKEVFIADDKYTTLKIPYVTSREYTEGIYGDNMDNITWGDLTSDAQPSNTPDIRDGVYENNKDSVSWEDLLAGATDIPAAQTES